MAEFNLEIPINNTSLGQIGWGVVKEIYRRGLEPNIFPIGGVDLKCFDPDPTFAHWLQRRISRSFDSFQGLPTIKHWHINGSERVVAVPSVLWTVHETDQLTPQEVEICRGYERVLVTSKYSQEVFKAAGVDAEICFNFIDTEHFKPVNQPQPAKYNWGIFGKMEKRKQTRNSIVAWANKFGGNKDHRLVCQIFNPFIDPRLQQQEINSWFGGRCPWNITFHGFQEKTADFNVLLNSVDILIGLSGAEGCNLPLLHALYLGKHAVVLDCTGHQDFANSENSVLVTPTSKEKIYDGMFFSEGAIFNQGQMFNFSQDAAFDGFQRALDKIDSCGKLNEAGTQLAETFTVKNTVDKLLSYVDYSRI